MSRRYEIAVGPVAGGWSLACDALGEPTMFLSGARAEAHARALALRLSQAGEEVELVVHDRSRKLIAQARYGSPELV